MPTRAGALWGRWGRRWCAPLLAAGVLTFAETSAADATSALAELDRLVLMGSADSAAVGRVLDQGVSDAMSGVDGLPSSPRELDPAEFQGDDPERVMRALFVTGELFRRAALADAGEAARYRQQARAFFRSLRFNHPDRPFALLGYVGEARVARDSGDTSEAGAALRPLLEIVERRQTQLPPQIEAAAILEQLEIRRVTDPAGAAEAALSAQKRPALRDGAGPALSWLRARALLEAAEQTGSADALGDALALAREASVATALASFDRLSLLVRAEAVTGAPVLTTAELAEWARLLASLGRNDEAVAAFRKLGDEALAPEAHVTYGALLHQVGEAEAAARQFAQAAENLSASHEVRSAALAGRVAALQSLPDADREELRRALIALADGPVEPAQKLAALRWLAADAAAAPAELLAVLERHADVVTTDSLLRVFAAETRWAAGTASDAAAIDAELVAIESEAGSDDAAWRAARLARVRIAASPAVNNARLALSLLDEAMPRLEEPQRGTAAAMQVELLLKLGLVDEAVAAWEAMPETVPRDAETALRLAELLAERSQADAATAASLRPRVVRLTSQALRSAAVDDARFAERARRAALALVAAGADVEAQQVLAQLRAAGGIDAAAGEALLALEAEVMLRRGQVPEALTLLTDAVRTAPDSVALQLAHGQALTAKGDNAAALAAYRRARQSARAGSPLWWRATLALAEAIRRGGNEADAQKLVRTASTLYAAPTESALRSQIDSILAIDATAQRPTSGTP